MTLTGEKFSAREAVKLTLPKEHGSWSLALEPVAFGLLAATSTAGTMLALAAVAGFFLRRPAKLVFANKSDERKPLALLCVMALAVVGLVALTLAGLSGSLKNLWPLLPAAVAGMAFVWFDNRNEAREGAAEIAGTIAFGFLPAAFGALAGWDVAHSLALAAVMLVRSVPTVLTVRCSLRLRKGQTISMAPALATALAGFFVSGWLAIQHLAPWLAMIFALIFAARTTWLLLWQPPLSARAVGITEAVLGVLMVLTLALVW